METLAFWTAILMNDLHVLPQLEGRDEESRIRYVLKEQAIAQHCCQAGENLTGAELARLKSVLGLTERQWHAYRSKLLPALE